MVPRRGLIKGRCPRISRLPRGLSTGDPRRGGLCRLLGRPRGCVGWSDTILGHRGYDSGAPRLRSLPATLWPSAGPPERVLSSSATDAVDRRSEAELVSSAAALTAALWSCCSPVVAVGRGDATRWRRSHGRPERHNAAVRRGRGTWCRPHRQMPPIRSWARAECRHQRQQQPPSREMPTSDKRPVRVR